MRIRGYLIVLGLCGLGLLTPAVAGAADCTDEQPFKASAGVGNAEFDIKVTCKGAWTVVISLSLGVNDVTTEFEATEDNTGKQCSGKMFTPTGGADEYDTQQATCKFTKEQQLKLSIKKQ
jgi:hypothetical protein